MKNEFVMVPRAELARLQENMDPHRGAVAWGIVCDLLEKPHQGEPVAWVRDDGDGCLEFTSPGDGIGYPVYRHADPAEVERLRESEKALAIDLADSLKQQCADMRTIDALRAKLAERDALLRDIKRYGLDAIQVGAGQSILDRLDAALSESAEPSAPVEIDERAAFDAAYERGDFYIEEARSGFTYQDYRRHQAWAVWKVRAALEGKP